RSRLAAALSGSRWPGPCSASSGHCGGPGAATWTRSRSRPRCRKTTMGEPAMAEGFIEGPGGRVWYRIAGTDRPGIPVLCLHGGPGMPHDYLEPLEDLASRRPVIFYDQLGCGRSDRPADDSLWTTDRFVEELAVVRAALGLERV